MRIWSIQHQKFVDLLQQKNILHAEWHYVTWAVDVRPQYEWLVRQMKKRGIDTQGKPPIWAWHSCRGWQRPPSVAIAYNLVGNGTNMVTLEMEVPPEMVLLSSYAIWCEIFYMENFEAIKSFRRYKIFQIEKVKFPYDCIQATLPFIDKEWITAIRPLPFKEKPIHS